MDKSRGFLGQRPAAFKVKVLRSLTKRSVRTGRVMDLDTGEEFYAIHSSQRYGAFVSTLRDAYCAVLHQIAEDCFLPEDFVFPQSNRIAHALYEHFGEVPDHPFETAEDYGVFRYPKNRKWYGLIMLLPRQKVEKDCPDPAEMLEILNVKIPPESRETLLKNDGVYPCYHMNRDNWISIALDDRLPDGTILELLRRSPTYRAYLEKQGLTGKEALQ